MDGDVFSGVGRFDIFGGGVLGLGVGERLRNRLCFTFGVGTFNTRTTKPGKMTETIIFDLRFIL